MNCSVITTANEMNDEQIVAFSKEIKLEELFSYAKEVVFVNSAFDLCRLDSMMYCGNSV